MVEAGDRLGLIVEAWMGLIRNGDGHLLERLLDERVIWQGLLPQLICHDRREVMGLLDRYRARPPRLTRIEAEEAGDLVAVSVEGPDFPEMDEQAAATPRSLLFTFRETKVVRMESFSSRDEAFAALRPPY